MSRLNDLFKDEKFLIILDTQMKLLASQKNVNPYPYFADKLGFKSSGAEQLKNHFNIFSTKYLKVEDLFLILDNLENHKKPVLDYLCDKYNFVCSNKAFSNTDLESMNQILNHIGSTSGNVFTKFLDFSSDNILEEHEIHLLLKCTLEARQQIVAFENALKAKLS